VCPRCYYQLRQLRVIAWSFTFKAVVSLANTFLLSRLDYCSFIFAGLPRVRIERLEWIHQAVVRLVGRFAKTNTISNICRRHCTGFHSQSPCHTGSHPWYCVFIWLLILLIAWTAPSSFSLCRPPCTPVPCPHWSKAPPKQYLFSVSPNAAGYFFAWPGLGVPLSGDPEAPLYKLLLIVTFTPNNIKYCYWHYSSEHIQY